MSYIKIDGSQGEGVSHRETQNWEGFVEYAAHNGMRSNPWPSKLDR